MGGGGGGYDRPSNNNGSGGGSGDSDEDGSSSVPPPEPDPEEETTGDQSEESNGTNDEATPEDPPATGGGGGSGAPIADPGEGSDGTPEEDNSESEEEYPDSENDEQEGGHEDCEEEHEENREQEGDDEDSEDDDNDQEEDEEDDEDDDEEDECLIAESTLLHSPNPEPLGDATEGDICSVYLRESAVCVVDSQGRTIGAIAEPWVSTLKECIEQGRQYRARILVIDGGKCEVRVTNKCLLYQDINLIDINTAVQDQLHSELSLSVETTTEDVVVVTADGSRVGDIPDPWDQLLKECINQGRNYQAEVRDITPEYCKVKIQSDTSDE